LNRLSSSSLSGISEESFVSKLAGWLFLLFIGDECADEEREPGGALLDDLND